MKRIIHLANFDKVSTRVLLMHPKSIEKKPRYANKQGEILESVRVAKSSAKSDLKALKSMAGKLGMTVEDLIKECNYDIDFSVFGKRLHDIKKVYLTDCDNQLAYNVYEQTVRKDQKGKETSRKKLESEPANINENLCLHISKLITLTALAEEFVINHTLQIGHTCALSYGFLYKLADSLQESNEAAHIDTSDGKPLRFERDGKPYRGFLTGRTYDRNYLLFLHLSNMPLQGV